MTRNVHNLSFSQFSFQFLVFSHNLCKCGKKTETKTEIKSGQIMHIGVLVNSRKVTKRHDNLGRFFDVSKYMFCIFN